MAERVLPGGPHVASVEPRRESDALALRGPGSGDGPLRLVDPGVLCAVEGALRGAAGLGEPPEPEERRSGGEARLPGGEDRGVVGGPRGERRERVLRPLHSALHRGGRAGAEGAEEGAHRGRLSALFGQAGVQAVLRGAHRAGEGRGEVGGGHGGARAAAAAGGVRVPGQPGDAQAGPQPVQFCGDAGVAQPRRRRPAFCAACPSQSRKLRRNGFSVEMSIAFRRRMCMALQHGHGFRKFVLMI
jgi:hypothetical protein